MMKRFLAGDKKRVILIVMCIIAIGGGTILFHIFQSDDIKRPLKLVIVLSQAQGSTAVQIKSGLEDSAAEYGDTVDILIPNASYDFKEYDCIISDREFSEADHVRTIDLDQTTEDINEWRAAVQFLCSQHDGSIAYVVDEESGEIPLMEVMREEDCKIEYGNKDQLSECYAASIFPLSDRATEWILECRNDGVISETIPVVGVALPENAVTLLENSAISAAFVTDYYLLGYQTVLSLHLEETVLLKRHLVTPDEIYKAENISLLFPFLY